MSFEFSHALEKTEQAASDFAHGIGDAFAGQFIEGPRQMLGTHANDTSGQNASTAETVGKFVGNSAIYLGTNFFVKRIPVVGQLAGGRLASLVTGGVLGFTAKQENSSWTERFEKGGLGVLTMGSLEFAPGLSGKLGLSGKTFGAGLARSVVANGLAGAVDTGGTIGIDEHRLPTAGELALGAGSWMVTGGILHSIGARVGESLKRPAPVPTAPFSAGTLNKVTLADGREYHAYVPKFYDAAKPTKTMFVLHGDVFSFQNKSPMMAVESGMNKLADERNFLVIYGRAASRAIDKGWLKPLGIRGESWNVRGARNITATWDSYDDVHYLDNVFSDVSGRFNVDQQALSMVGFSDGGRMTHRYALERPGRLAAIASVVGTVLGDEPKPGPETPRPDVLIIHGTSGKGRLDRDLLVPWEGGLGPASGFTAWGGLFDGLKNSQPSRQVELWQSNPDARRLTTTDGNITHTVIDDNGHRIEQYLVKGAQHAWHGTFGKGGLPIIGARSQKPEVSKLVADFLLSRQLADGRLDIQRSLAQAS